MLDANLKIITELKDFITLVANNREVLNNFCVSESDFTRVRKLPFDKLALMIAKLCKKTLSIELESFFREIDVTEACTVSAFSQQRLKLEPSFFQWWNTLLWNSFYCYYGDAVKRWEGYRIIAADGSTISLVNNPALSKFFGGQSNQQKGFVLARAFYYYDVLNELVVSAQIKPYRTSELSIAYNSVDLLGDDTVTVYDRYFSSYKMVALHLWQETEKKFVIRAQERQGFIKAFIKTGERSSIVYMKPSPEAIRGMGESGYKVTKSTQLKVRLVRVDLPSCTEVLITNLWEEDVHPADEFKDLYFMRWGVETNISIQKNILQLESFSGLTPRAVQQDFHATIFMANLQSVLIKEAQATVEKTKRFCKYPVKINRNKSAGKLKANLVSLFLDDDPYMILIKLHRYFIKDVLPVRKGRSFKRQRKNVQSKSKHKTFTNFKPSY